MSGNGDYIKREDAIEALEQNWYPDTEFEAVIGDIPAADVVPMDYHERCLQIEVKNRLALERKMLRWIPVTERLPKEWAHVLALISLTAIDEPPIQQVLWYIGNGKWRSAWNAEMVESDVTHWMPLPEPQKEE